MRYNIFLFLMLSLGCKTDDLSHQNSSIDTTLVLLGTVQDAGSPHIGCKKNCCKTLFESKDYSRKVISLGLFDASTEKKYLFEASPDISSQIKDLKNFQLKSEKELPDGIFLTHAHIGHYAGLMYLGKEAIDAKNIPVYAMPRMRKFLKENGPWSQLVERGNIDLKNLENGVAIQLSDSLKVIPFKVPHRDEFSETVGYKIIGPNKLALFIPDIDKWEKWDRDIIEEIGKVDYAFLDATFYSGEELHNRDISEIPHPFIIESFQRFDSLPKSERKKIVFIHFNHTNPVLNPDSIETKEVLKRGYKLGRKGDIFKL